MHIRHYHPQDHIIRRSEQSSAMFYVLRGTVKVASSDSEATYQEIKENNFFGDVGVLYRVPRSMDVLAKNRCAIAILSGDDLVKAMEQSPEMAKAIGYQTQERYQMYLKRRHSISVRRNMDGGANMPEPIQDESQSENFAKCDVRSAIEKVPLFQSCSTEVVHMLSLKVEPRKYNLGESIISRGEIGREMFFIVSGVVEVLSDDNLKVLARFHEGQFFGEIAVLLDVPRIANVRAVSEVEVFVLTKDNLEAVFQAVPGAAETITSEGHRLYKNWLHRGEDQAMGEDAAEINMSESLGSQDLKAPSLQRKQSGDKDGGVVQHGTDQESTLGLSSGSIHPIEAGHPAAISVLPMTFSAISSSPRSTSPITSDSGTSEFAPGVLPESLTSPKKWSFDQDASNMPPAEEVPQPPVNRNPTIRGLQESNPKRRRASVAVWTQQDLMKLAEAATAKGSTGVSHVPTSSTGMAISLVAADCDDSSATAKRPSNASGTRTMPFFKPRTGPATFQDLDEFIVAQILNALPLNRLLRSRRVCKTWNKLILEHDQVLKSLDLSGYKKIVTDSVLEDLCNTVLSKNRARTLRVSLRDCFSISDKGLTLLAAHMPAVQELDLHSCWNVTDNGFKSLSEHCPQVRSIDFSNCRKLGDETIFALYPKESILANTEPTHKKHHHPQAALGSPSPVHPELKEQDNAPADTSMDDVQAILTHRPSMEEGSDSEGNHDTEHKSPLGMDVESPKPIKPIAKSSASAAVLRPRGCPLLARLNLSYCKNLTDRSFIHLSQYGSRQLESLNLQRCTTITSDAYISLDLDNRRAMLESSSIANGYDCTSLPVVEPCFPRLRELFLSDCTFLSDNAILALAPNVPRLEVLSLSFCCALTDVAVEAVCENCRYLKKLDLSFCGSAVSDASLYQLAQMDSQEPGKHTLEDLEIRGCVRVTEQGVRQVLNGCVNLKKLNVSSCSGIGTGDLSTPSPPQPTSDGSGTQQQQASEQANCGGSNGSWGSLSNGNHTNELTRKMNALKRGKEWALAQRRPGLKIIV
ncbi:hypothetical protein BGX31_005242 [Mortierella sp. GBA43]|nr:hypothetical protein BGX31_005242 [Mortierella sp. GBA43]